MNVVHIAGFDVEVGCLLRQRCAWCGAVLVDYDLHAIAVPIGQESDRPGTWPVGGLVAIDGALSYSVPHVDGDDLPPGACATLDPDVTL